MKLTQIVLAIALAAGALASGMALADHGRGRVTFGINLGVPLGPWYYPPYYPPYYAPNYSPYPPVIAVQPSAPVYVEKSGDAASPSAPSSNYWYYCPDSQSYYPYVQECRTGWMTVLPTSPPQPR